MKRQPTTSHAAALAPIVNRLTASELAQAAELAPYVMPTGFYDTGRMHQDRHNYTRGAAAVADFFGDCDEMTTTAAAIDPLIALAMRINDMIQPIQEAAEDAAQAAAAQPAMERIIDGDYQTADLAAIVEIGAATWTTDDPDSNRRTGIEFADAPASALAGQAKAATQAAGAVFVAVQGDRYLLAAAEAAQASRLAGNIWIPAIVAGRPLDSKIRRTSASTPDWYYVQIAGRYFTLPHKAAIAAIAQAWREEAAGRPKCHPAILLAILFAGRSDAE